MTPTLRSIAGIALAALCFAVPGHAGEFVYQAERALAPGTWLHFTKSNRDGSRPWQIELFVASPTRINVVKWAEGASDFVEVNADIDLARAMPVNIQQWNTAGGRREPRLAMNYTQQTLQVKLANGQQVQVPHAEAAPLQFWGFDLMGVAFMLPHLTQPETGFAIEFVDPNKRGSEGQPFGQGLTRFEPIGEETIDGVVCRKYRISGPLFGDKEGFLWVDRSSGRIERAEHADPTSTDWTDWKLDFTGVEQADALAFEAFKLKLADAQTRGGGASLAATMRETFQQRGIDAVLAGIDGWQAASLKGLENDLNTLGYTLLGEQRTADAVKLFEAVTRRFPDSANAWDSLGEAQLAAGDRKASLASYRRSLKLDPSNDHAREQIAALERDR